MDKAESFARRVFLARLSGLGSAGLLGPTLAGLGPVRVLGADLARGAADHPAFAVRSRVALDVVTPADWAPFVGSVFRVHLPKRRFVDVELVGIKPFPPAPPHRPAHSAVAPEGADFGASGKAGSGRAPAHAAASPRQSPPARARRPGYALRFEGPARFPLPQDSYLLEHRMIGAFPLFLVPIGPYDGPVIYEAAFG